MCVWRIDGYLYGFYYLYLLILKKRGVKLDKRYLSHVTPVSAHYLVNPSSETGFTIANQNKVAIEAKLF